MNPLELEMYHQMKNVVGVSPTFYEYLFMVDADTTVEELSLNRLVSAYVLHLLLVLRELTSQDDARQEDNRCLWGNFDYQCKAVDSHNGAGASCGQTCKV